jgi:transcriptional regulator with XRE-family HTH domain
METNWSDRVKQLEENGMSLTAIGELIGLSPQGVSDIKQGRTKAPTGDAAVALHKLHSRRCLRFRRAVAGQH